MKGGCEFEYVDDGKVGKDGEQWEPESCYKVAASLGIGGRDFLQVKLLAI